MAISMSSVWSDLDHRLIPDSLGNIKKVINVDAVMTSIDNILRTYPGERVMLPEFASSLHGIVFENTNKTLLDYLSRDLKDTIERWDDRIIIQGIKFYSDPDQGEISLAISFGIRGSGQMFTYSKAIKGEII